MSDITKVQCRKCLLEDMDENDFLRDMRSHIAAYPEDKKYQRKSIVGVWRFARIAKSLWTECAFYAAVMLS